MKKINTLFIIGMILAWSTYFLVSKYAVDYLGSAYLAGLILRAVTFVALTIFLLVKKQFLQLFRVGKVAFLLLIIGVLGFLLDTFANIGFMHGSVSTGTILLKLDILMANFATCVIFKEKLKLRDHIATAIMLIGVILTLNIDLKNLSFNWYDIFFVLSALAVTVNAFVIKGVQTKYNVSSETIAYYNNFVVMMLFLGSSLIFSDINIIGERMNTNFMLLATLGGIAQGLIYIFYYRNLKFYPVWQVKLFLLFVPIVSCIVGAILFKEQFGWQKILGLIFVLIGSVIMLTRNKNKIKETVDDKSISQ